MGRSSRWMGSLVAVAILAHARPAAAISCTFVTVTSTAFGSYDPVSATPTDSAGSLTINCTSVLPADNITVDISKGSSSTFLPRNLLYMTNVLQYNLYLDAARTSVWGDGTGGTSHYGPANPPNGTNFTLNVYGRIPANQTSAIAGSYSDTVTVTINF